MTPEEIITMQIATIPNIRIPMVALTVRRIMRALDEAGYKIKDKTLDDVR